jgi:hypothetical protein
MRMAHNLVDCVVLYSTKRTRHLRMVYSLIDKHNLLSGILVKRNLLVWILISISDRPMSIRYRICTRSNLRCIGKLQCTVPLSPATLATTCVH